jgi:DNA-binding transcriptional LysR family regulator
VSPARTATDKKKAAAATLGVAIVPRTVSRGRSGLHALTFDPPKRGRLMLAWRSRGPVSLAARVLIDMARRCLRVGVSE